MNSSPRFVVGIDLGTTNCAAAWVDSQGPDRLARPFLIPQLVAPGEIEALETLPSFHYEPAPGEFAPGALRLPWEGGEPAGWIVGAFARDHGGNVPGRLIASAKSWLSHSGVDRSADLLPWHGAPEVKKISPAETAARFLGHLRSAWNLAHPDEPLEAQDVVLTIPASFDEVARELTLAAARRAGLSKVVLLEEPQAAFYAWVHSRGADWRALLRPGQRILVCDIGGGTSDFSLIEARAEGSGAVRFHRVAVGEHLILGGDNLDLALAHFIEERWKAAGTLGLEPRLWSVLVGRCRRAKETLLGENAPPDLTLSLPARGSRLIGGALEAPLEREAVRTLLLEGFLPSVDLSAEPLRRASGFLEFGLPYAADPAISRHLAAFLRRHPGRPDAVLLNGGLFASPVLRERLLEILARWFPAEPGWRPLVLENPRLDLAVAFGAAHYGMVRRGDGERIAAGLARSYFIGVKTPDPRPMAVCLVPAGLEEGREVVLAGRRFELLVRRPAEFALFSSSVRTRDEPGALVELNPEEFSALPPIRTVLKSRGTDRESIPVSLHARLTEIGTLEVWCSEAEGNRKWRLQFDVRAARPAVEAAGAQGAWIDEDTIERCAALIREAFGESSAPVLAESLVKRLETLTQGAGAGTRWEWPPSFLRRLWEEVFQNETRRTPLHEARWLNLLGFALRPGDGFPLDDWRVAQTWKLAAGGRGVLHPRNELCRAEWWVLWRRVSGGLSAGQQKTLADPLVALLRRNGGRPEARWGSHETAEVWRMLGAFELLEAPTKIILGQWLLDALQSAPDRAALWTLGRLGARVPLYGPLNTLVPPETVETWLPPLLAALARENRPPLQAEFHFALTQLARRTGDRYRDLSEPLRLRALAALENAPPHFRALVESGGSLREAEQSLAFGEALPQGLQLAT